MGWMRLARQWIARVSWASTRVGYFAKRHAWSLSLSGLSTVSFMELAREVGQGKLGPLDRQVSRHFSSSQCREDRQWAMVGLAEPLLDFVSTHQQ